MDCFEVLGLERRLVVNEEELRESFDLRCRDVHPDAGGGDPDRFQELGKAYSVLRSPGRRLRHWLELELGGAEPGNIPDRLMSLFGDLGMLLQEVDAILVRRSEARSALGQSLAERESLAVLPKLEATQQRLDGIQRGLEAGFEGFEAQGAAARRVEASETMRALIFVEKWQREVRERWAKLAVI